MQRYALRDDQWLKIKDFLPGREGHVGGTAPDNRLFVDAVIYRYPRCLRGRRACVRGRGVSQVPAGLAVAGPFLMCTSTETRSGLSRTRPRTLPRFWQRAPCRQRTARTTPFGAVSSI